MSRLPLAVAAVLVASAFGLGACRSGAARSAADVPTLAIENHEYGVRRYVGRTVRVCGRLTRYETDWGIERVTEPGEFYFHGLPTVLIVPCGAEPPRLDSDGCITGRVAARDGRLELPARRTVLQDDSPVDREWFLHPQCRRRR
jgi:hypothetical protein